MHLFVIIAFAVFGQAARASAGARTPSGSAGSSAALRSSPVSTVAGASKWAGVNFVAEGFEGPLPFDAPASLASLATARALGVNTVAFSFPWYTASVNATAPAYRVDGGVPSGVPFSNASSPSDSAVVTAVRAARALGLRVILRPMIDPDWRLAANAGAWRGEIGKHFSRADWAAWFDSYRAFILRWAAVAAAEHVDVLCVGAELEATEGQDADWRSTIAAVRAVFSGVVYYSATGADLSWWDASDWIAQDMYPALTDAKADPAATSADALVAAWSTFLAPFQAMAAKHNRSVLLQETGICSIDKVGLYSQPWFYDCYQYPVNEDVQAKYYEAVFREFGRARATSALCASFYSARRRCLGARRLVSCARCCSFSAHRLVSRAPPLLSCAPPRLARAAAFLLRVVLSRACRRTLPARLHPSPHLQVRRMRRSGLLAPFFGSGALKADPPTPPFSR